MTSIFEKVEAAYLDRVIPNAYGNQRRDIIIDLIAAHKELEPEQVRLAEEFFAEHGTLVGLAIKYRED